MKIITREEATTVKRPENGPWEWPDAVRVAVSNSWSVDGGVLDSLRTARGDPLDLALAVRYLESLYDGGYRLVKLEDEDFCVAMDDAVDAGRFLPTVILEGDPDSGTLQIPIDLRRR